jgi:DtxR family Mn-dependent transcriptional regulator
VGLIVEALQQLTRRQLVALQALGRLRARGTEIPLNDVAHALGIRPPSALPHLKALERLGLVERRAGKSRVTPRGAACLVEYQRHHRVAERLFAHLQLPAQAACRAAQEIDLALSHRTVEALCEAEGHPAVCPHGEPIGPCRGDRAAR